MTPQDALKLGVDILEATTRLMRAAHNGVVAEYELSHIVASLTAALEQSAVGTKRSRPPCPSTPRHSSQPPSQSTSTASTEGAKFVSSDPARVLAVKTMQAQIASVAEACAVCFGAGEPHNHLGYSCQRVTIAQKKAFREGMQWSRHTACYFCGRAGEFCGQVQTECYHLRDVTRDIFQGILTLPTSKITALLEDAGAESLEVPTSSSLPRSWLKRVNQEMDMCQGWKLVEYLLKSAQSSE